MIPLKYKILFIVPLLFISCKPKQVITEEIYYRSDSSAVLVLEEVITQKEIQIFSLQSELNRFEEENFNLKSEISTYEINYDTTQPINPVTQKPPISSEIITRSNSQLEKTLNQYEVLLREASIENTYLTTKNSNLQLTVEALKEENKTLNSKPNSGTQLKFKLLLSGVITGIIICLIIIRR
jgi:cell division protein FtsB